MQYFDVAFPLPVSIRVAHQMLTVCRGFIYSTDKYLFLMITGHFFMLIREFIFYFECLGRFNI